MRQEHYDAISSVLNKAGIGPFEIRPQLWDDEDVLSAEVFIDPDGVLPDADPQRSTALAANALAAAGLVRLYRESDAQLVAKSVGPGYVFLVDSQWQRPSPGTRAFPVVHSRRI